MVMSLLEPIFQRIYFSENRTSDRDFLGPWVNQGNRKIMRTSWNWLKICDEKREEEIGVRVAYLWFQHLLFLLCTFLYPPTSLYDFDIYYLNLITFNYKALQRGAIGSNADTASLRASR